MISQYPNIAFINCRTHNHNNDPFFRYCMHFHLIHHCPQCILQVMLVIPTFSFSFRPQAYFSNIWFLFGMWCWHFRAMLSSTPSSLPSRWEIFHALFILLSIKSNLGRTRRVPDHSTSLHHWQKGMSQIISDHPSWSCLDVSWWPSIVVIGLDQTIPALSWQPPSKVTYVGPWHSFHNGG